MKNTEKTPNGGDYSEIYYSDDEGNLVPEEKATKGEIVEFLNDGTVVGRTYFTIDQNYYATNMKHKLFIMPPVIQTVK